MDKKFIKLLKPQNIFLTKKRLGPNEDGGYVMPHFVFENCSALFSYGIGADSRFEVDFTNTYKKPAYLFDHTIRIVEPDYVEQQREQWAATEKYWEENNCHFYPHGLGFTENCKDFNDDYDELNINGHVLLKIDIEGGEFEYFPNTDINRMADRVMGLSLEVHWINDLGNRQKLVEILEKIEEHFILCHIHGNNWGETWDFENYPIPVTLELSFINKKFVMSSKPDDQDYPIEGLDIPNRPGYPDHKLTFLNMPLIINEESVNEEPVNEEPVNEEPVNEEPVNEEPVNEEPVNEEIESFKSVFTKIYDNDGFFSGGESRSGSGSSLEMTEEIRKKIVDLIKEKNIKSITDIPCGDFNWMKEIVFRFEKYIGGDIVPLCVAENLRKYSNAQINFIEHDISKHPIPISDLLFVRDLIGHYPLEEGKKIVNNILDSKCKYLLTTTWYHLTDKTYNKQHINEDIPLGRWYALNLMSEPFNFPEPDYIIEEINRVEGYDDGIRKILGLWEIEKLKNIINKNKEQNEILEPASDIIIEKPIENILNNLFEIYGTDKSKSGYGYYYGNLFKDLREKKMNVLEIGIGSLIPGIPSTFHGILQDYPKYRPGGSLRAWKDYFINSQIYGVDIANDCLFEEDRIKTFIFDSLDKEKCDENLENLSFNIILDDGLHTPIAQITTLKNLFDRVRIGGYYIIEDNGGNTERKNIFDLYDKEFREIAEEHEFVNLGNCIIIRKNNSGRGQILNFKEFIKTDGKPISIKDIEKEKKQEELKNSELPPILNKDLTVVTGLWNIGRMGRDFTHYIEHFKKFLEIPVNMLIYVPKEYEYLVWEKRTTKNTHVKIAELEYIKDLYAPFWEKTQSLRTDPKWLNMSGENGWLIGSPQATLEYYNPIVQSKMFLLNDATIWNPFDTEYFIWLDAGITNTVYEKYFTENRALDKIIPHLSDFLFLSYPYEATNEIHGFDFQAMNRYAGSTVKYVCRGGLFGGNKEMINQANATYYSTLYSTMTEGYMGTEESIFTIMSYREPNLYRRFALDGNGLIVKFIESLINDTVELVEKPKNAKQISISNYELSKLKTNLYILTFNFPEQVQHTINTMEKVPEWLKTPHLVLIDNSTNEEAIKGNKLIAEKYNMEYIKMERNTGICGGRQKAAEHFNESDADFMFFFEDDMTINPPEFEGQFCRNGFRKYVPNLYNIVHKIMLKENFDFLKLSWTEVFFDNDKSLPWYNVPQHIRTRDWPDYSQLPITGLDPNSPPANYKHMKTCDGIAYLIGDVNYANWPMIVSKEGNKKMFIDTTWAHPYEQTWSSHMYNLIKDGSITAGILLTSPIWHDRIKHYEPEERREN